MACGAGLDWPEYDSELVVSAASIQGAPAVVPTMVNPSDSLGAVDLDKIVVPKKSCRDRGARTSGYIEHSHHSQKG